MPSLVLNILRATCLAEIKEHICDKETVANVIKVEKNRSKFLFVKILRKIQNNDMVTKSGWVEGYLAMSNFV